MPYRRVSYLELGWFIVRQKIRDLLFGCDREDPCKPIYTKLPDGATVASAINAHEDPEDEPTVEDKADAYDIIMGLVT